jgi:uncharacterized membrane protein YphA (DoxX/SURF4 family)
VRWLGLAVRLGAAGIWLAAGAAKVGELATFKTQVAAYDLLPNGLVGPFAYVLPFVELLVGIYLAVGLLIRPAAILGCVLMVMFVVALSQAWARGLVLNCGCFGTLSLERVGGVTVARDVALGIPTLLMAIWPARFLSLDARLWGLPDRFFAPAEAAA